MRGRKPTPPALKLVTDNVDAYTADQSVTKAERGIPSCPAHLSPSAKAEWKRLASELFGLRIFCALDRSTLAAYCQAYGRWVEAERQLRQTPMLLKMPSGYIQQSPWLTISNKQIELMHRYITDLGLSPVARARMDTRTVWRRDLDDDPDGDFD
jgi:P27 family predicted phage terminase small subunit